MGLLLEIKELALFKHFAGGVELEYSHRLLHEEYDVEWHRLECIAVERDQVFVGVVVLKFVL